MKHTYTERFYLILMNSKHSLITLTESESTVSVHISSEKINSSTKHRAKYYYCDMGKGVSVNIRQFKTSLQLSIIPETLQKLLLLCISVKTTPAHSKVEMLHSYAKWSKVGKSTEGNAIKMIEELSKRD